MKDKKDIKVISTPDSGYFDFSNLEPVKELNDFILAFMQRYGIGKYISATKWGSHKVKTIQKILYDTLLPPKTKAGLPKPSKNDIPTIKRPKSSLTLFVDLQKDVRSKKFTKNDFSRVARTETAAMKVIYQLLKWQESGFIYVTHKNNRGSVSRKTVGSRDKLYNNREFKIDYLLSKRGEKDRIPLHPNCMCWYKMNTKGMK